MLFTVEFRSFQGIGGRSRSIVPKEKLAKHHIVQTGKSSHRQQFIKQQGNSVKSMFLIEWLVILPGKKYIHIHKSERDLSLGLKKNYGSSSSDQMMTLTGPV